MPTRDNTFCSSLRYTHHFDFINYNNKIDCCFLRISKCASTSIVRSFNLFNIKHVSEVPKNCNISALIRNPIGRFFSSIPETFCRLTIPMANYCNHSGDIAINYDLAEELFSLDLDNPACLVSKYLQILQNGIFDAHHCPQYYFFKAALDYELEFDICVIDRMNNLPIFKHGHKNKTESNKKNTKKSIKEWLKNHFNKSLNELKTFRRRSITAKIIQKYGNEYATYHDNLVTIKTKNMIDCSSKFYKDLLLTQDNINNKRAIQDIYEKDFKIFNLANKLEILKISSLDLKNIIS